MSDEEINELVEKIESGEIKGKTHEMDEYEQETGKYAKWRGVVTESFKKWLRGEPIYDRDKERISLYVSKDTKQRWDDFLENNNYTTISKLVRESVNKFIDRKSNSLKQNAFKMNSEAASNISHDLKEPLTTIKGFSQLLLENYKNKLNEEVLGKIESIFEQSLLLEKKIKNILDDINVEKTQYDILLIEDDLATIRILTTYFESKGYICRGVVSGTRGIEELKQNRPKVILLDIILPDLDGWDLCKMIKSDKRYQEIPVFILTAIPESEVKKKLDDIDTEGYILKPFDFQDFTVIFEHL